MRRTERTTNVGSATGRERGFSCPFQVAQSVHDNYLNLEF